MYQLLFQIRRKYVDDTVAAVTVDIVLDRVEDMSIVLVDNMVRLCPPICPGYVHRYVQDMSLIL